jgi:hypothetical protein
VSKEKQSTHWSATLQPATDVLRWRLVVQVEPLFDAFDPDFEAGQTPFAPGCRTLIKHAYETGSKISIGPKDTVQVLSEGAFHA